MRNFSSIIFTSFNSANGFSYYLMIHNLIPFLLNTSFLHSIHYGVDVGIVASESVIVQTVAHDEVVGNVHGYVFDV